MPQNQRFMEIPVQHEAGQSKLPAIPNWGPQQMHMQYPQSRSPPQMSTPPRIGTPPKSQSQTPPKFFTLPRNHRAPEAVREIPIQHFSSKQAAQGNNSQGDMNYPKPDYPGAPNEQQATVAPQPVPNQGQHPNFSQGYPYPQQQQPGMGQGFPQPLPSQGYPYSYPNTSQFGPQGHVQYPQYTMPQPPMQTGGQSYPPPQQQGPPMPQPSVPQEQQCAPPMREQHVEYNIPIVREQADNQPITAPQTSQQMPAGFQTWPRQPKPQREQQFPSPQPKATATAERTDAPEHRSREQTPGNVGLDQTDQGAHQQPQINQQHTTQKQNGQSAEQQRVPKTPLELIHSILSECQQYKDRVNSFSGTKKTKEYKILEEMLTRSLLKLDGVESGQDLSIRQARRTAVKEIQSYLDQLELKAFSDEGPVAESSSATSDTGNGSAQEPMDASSQNNSAKDDRNVKEMVLESEVSC